MKAAIYNPYLDSLGGGERYSIAVAKVLRDAGYSVNLSWKNPDIKAKLIDRFGIDISDINVVPDIKKGDGYDICFWVSDGSVPNLLARKNFLHFQVPFQNVNGNTLLNRMKFFRIKKIICNSFFTKKVIDREFGITSIVIYPPVDISSFRPGKKENIILYVGRFSKLLQRKRHDILIKSFKKLYDSGFKNFRLIIAGGVEAGAESSIDEHVKDSVGYPIKFVENPSFKELKKFYSISRIFWSASGYGIDELKEPEKVEHFGITVVEAMAGGAVPLVYSGGGHKEIVDDSVNGYLWKTPASLLYKTKNIIENPKLLRQISKEAVLKSHKFSYERFKREIIGLI